MSDLPFVMITHELPDEWIAQLNGRCRLIIGPEKYEGLAPELEAHLPKIEGLLSMLTVPVDETLLAKAIKLRVVSNMAVGVDNVDLQACANRNIPVGHTPGVLVEACADFTMALLLAAARRLPDSSADARNGKWDTWTATAWLGKDVGGATLGIVGMGKIGHATARRAKAFGMRIVYTSRKAKPEAEAEMGATRLPLDELLAQSDFVSLHTPLTPETRGLMDLAAFQRMKSDAILINMARGPVVDSNALIHALREGLIGFAALDVTDPEPLPPHHILYSMANCFITPHIGSASMSARRGMAELACENLLTGLNGRLLTHCANKELLSVK